MRLQVEDVRRALQSSDPDLARLWLAQLVDQPEPPDAKPPREGALTWDRYFRTLRSGDFRRKKPEEREAYRRSTVSALESPQAEVPLPPRLKAHEILLELWNDAGRRGQLLSVLAEVPLVYGPWRALKRIFKESEARDDVAVWGLLAARFDAAFAGFGPSGPRGRIRCEVSEATLGYLVRRAWRRLRRLGAAFPALYPDAASTVLRNYPAGTRFRDTWIANQIFYHAGHSRTRRVYNTSRFTGHGGFRSLTAHRAFPEAWSRSPRPLLNLLAAAQAEEPRKFAIDLLKSEFRAVLREVEPTWIAGLVAARSEVADEFFVWMLQNVSRFEQSKLRELGLHEAVLKLFDSPSSSAVQFAADYARTHARDLSVDELIRLASKGEVLSKLAVDLLSARHPVKDVGLDAWGRLLDSGRGDGASDAHKLAIASLGKHFGPSELTAAWFQDRLVGVSDVAREFAHQHLPRLHDVKALGSAYFLAAIDRIDPERLLSDRTGAMWNLRPNWAAEWLLGQLKKTSLEAIPGIEYAKLLLNPLTRTHLTMWIDQGAAKASQVPLPLLRAMASRKDWDASEEIRQIRSLPQAWAQELQFSAPLGEKVRGWLRDVRQFAPADLGRDWLLDLLDSGDSSSVEFASDVLIRGFIPADFAPKSPAAEGPGTADASAPATVDLQGASFLFTGKLATMERAGAEEKVLKAGGSNASGVTAKLNYLVIGDEGSPLYGAGRKGSKQLKGEELIAKGAALKIISETAFLQMLAGRPAVADADQSAAGCEALWKMAAGDGKEDAPRSAFARKYILRHHPDVCLAETDRPVDPGAEIPPAFLSFERVKPLFADSRKPIRDLALKLAAWEFARWAPPMAELVKLCETPHSEVRNFVAKSLMAEPTPEHRRYRVDPAVLTADAVYGFCESRDDGARGLGMQLIQLHPRLQVPDELFRLTESPDRVMRAFVIRILWGLYRDRGVTRDWKPTIPPTSTIGLKNKAAAEKKAPDRGTGTPPHPEKLPAALDALRAFLRRTLFEIPPARFEKAGAEGDALRKRLKPLAAREAKLALIETLRDAALEDAQFADVVRPLFEEFRGSRGKSEFSACMVAIARLRARHEAAAT